MRRCAIDLVTGVAKPADAQPAADRVDYKDKRWDIAHVDGRVVGYAGGTRKVAWTHRASVHGACSVRCGCPRWSPMVRVANAGAFRGLARDPC